MWQMRKMKSSSDSKHPSSCINFVDLDQMVLHHSGTLQKHSDYLLRIRWLNLYKSLSDFKD